MHTVKKVEFRRNVGSTPGEEAVEFAVDFQHAEGTFHLNETDVAKFDFPFGFDVLPGMVTEPK